MKTLKHLLTQNKQWAKEKTDLEPDFFKSLSAQQSPQYLWIGCSDSRVPANTIVGLQPGEIFVHRNIANLVVHTDFNCLSVIEYSVEVLKVKHIIVCGHYGCGGIQAALGNSYLGLTDNWLRHIKDVYNKNDAALSAITQENLRWKKLCELNVLDQVSNVCNTTIVQRAWNNGADLSVHGWVYDIKDGIIKDLSATTSTHEETSSIYRMVDDV